MKIRQSALALLFASSFVIAAGCSSKKTPSAAATNVKADSGAGTGSGSSTKKPKKGSSATSAESAKSEKQKAGGKAEEAQSKAESKGDTYEEIACDDETEDLGFCGDDSHIIFCNGGTWYALDCSAVDEQAFCGEEVDVVDCYVPVDEDDDDGDDDEEDDGT